METEDSMGSAEAVVTETPDDYDGLRTLLLGRRESMPKRLKQIAAFALEHPEDVAFGTVAGIAEHAGVQPSTLVRFAKSLGYDGFSHLQQIFRDLHAGTQHITSAPMVVRATGRELADMVDEDGAYAKLPKGIGAIGDDRKHPSGAKQVNGIGLGQGLDGAGEFLGAHRSPHPLQRDGCRTGEAFEQGHRMNVVPLGIAQAPQALAVVRKALPQAVAEDLL